MEIPHEGTFCQRMMPHNVMQRIQWVHQEQGPKIIASWLHKMYIWLGFSPKAANLLNEEKETDSPERLRVLTDKNVDDIYNNARKPGSKNANQTPDGGQQASFIAQENLKLAAFLFHHSWRCTLDWEVEWHDDTVHLLADQKKLKDEYRDPDLLPKINISDMEGMMESIKEYLRLHHGVLRASLHMLSGTPYEYRLLTKR